MPSVAIFKGIKGNAGLLMFEIVHVINSLSDFNLKLHIVEKELSFDWW